MRIKFGIDYYSGEDKLPPKFVCPVCSQVGLVFDPDEKNLQTKLQRCLCCGYRYNSNFQDPEKNWHDAWIECGRVNLSEIPCEERSEYYTKIRYAFFAKYRYVLSDDEIEKREFDDRLFTQYGFVNSSDSSKKISVRCEDGRCWQFDYKTNTIFYLDDTMKFFAVGEESDRGRYYLFASEYLTENSSCEKEYRGFYLGFIPDLFGAYYSLDNECVLTDREDLKYYFNIEPLI